MPIKTNASLLDRRNAAVPRGVASATNVFTESALNARLVDVEGKSYIDFAGGIGVLATGHRHPHVMAAVERQLQQFTHTAFQVSPYEAYIELAERLNKRAPFVGAAKTILFTTGAEAVENAVKIARVATGRQAIVAFSHAFHGRTLLTSTLTGKIRPYKKMAGAPAPEIYRLPFPIEHGSVSVGDMQRAIEELFFGDVEANRVAAFIVEPVQGEGGFNPASKEMLRALRAVCDAHGILLIADEIQSGFGRTGRLFAIEHSEVEPDLVAIAKSLAGGFPLSAVLGRAAIMDCVEPGGLGGTYAGSPVGCAAANAVLDVIETGGLLKRAEMIGQNIRNALNPAVLGTAGARIANIRGLGAMIGFDVVHKQDPSRPDGISAKKIVARALERGLVVLTCGSEGETIRILVPLTIPKSDLEEGLSILKDCIGWIDGGVP